MWKKILSWVSALAKSQAIELVKSQEDAIKDLIRKNADPDIVAKNIVNWLVAKIEKI